MLCNVQWPESSIDVLWTESIWLNTCTQHFNCKFMKIFNQVSAD